MSETSREKLLQMTTKEIETFLNSNISSVVKSIYADDVKGQMIEDVKKLFDDTVDIRVPYYTNTELVIQIDKINISFKVGSKNTGKTKSVSRLRKKDVKTIGKFKFYDIQLYFYNPYFKADDLDNYKIKVSENTVTGGAEISLKHRKEKIIDMITKDILLEEIQKQDSRWNDIRKTVVLSAAQPKIQKDLFQLNQEKWDYILQKTEEVNKDLIDKEIEKIFKILN